MAEKPKICTDFNNMINSDIWSFNDTHNENLKVIHTCTCPFSCSVHVNGFVSTKQHKIQPSFITIFFFFLNNICIKYYSLPNLHVSYLTH